MNWVRNNRFLATFLAVMLVGVGGLGFLLYSSFSRYQQINTDYTTQVAELNRLQNLKPYPDAASQKMYEAVRHDYEAAVVALQSDLASHEPPPEPPLSPIQFQDKLRTVVADVANFAQQSGVALPDGFYLGFDQYRGSPPDAAAAPLLNNELSAISELVTILIKARIDKVTAVRRALLPQESPGAAAPRAAASAKPGAPGGEALSKQAVEIAFTTLPTSFRETLNNISHAKRLYVVRALQVKNEVDKGPSRDDNSNVPGGTRQAANSTPAPTAPEPGGVPNPPLPEKGDTFHFVVGQEKLDVLARIDLIRVLPITAAPVSPR